MTPRSRPVTRGGAVILLVLAGVLAPIGLGGDPGAAEAPAPDRRQALRLAPAERNAVRAEMRQMLASVAGVVRAAAAGDLAQVEKSARAAGMGGAVDPQLEKKLPRPFLHMGEGVHRGFDALADAAKGGASKNALLGKLADVMSGCVACHATYRFPDAR